MLVLVVISVTCIFGLVQHKILLLASCYLVALVNICFKLGAFVFYLEMWVVFSFLLLLLLFLFQHKCLTVSVLHAVVQSLYSFVEIGS